MSEELIYINGSYQRPNSVKKEVSKAVKELVGLAPEEFDTMQELAEAVQENTKAIQDNAEALQNVKIEAAAPLEFKDGEVKLNYDSGLQVIDKRLCLKKASFDHMGGVKIGTGYYGDKGGIECTDSGRIGLLPPSQSNLGGIKTPKLHNNTPPIKTTSDGSYYQIETDVYGNAFVRIPKTPESNVSVKIASLNTPGLIKLGTDDLDQHHFGLRTKKDGNAYVNLTDFVPYSVSSADSTKYGGIKLGYSENESNYAVKLDSEGHAYVDLSNFSAPANIQVGPGLTFTYNTININYGDGLWIDTYGQLNVNDASYYNAGVVHLGMNKFYDNYSNAQPIGVFEFNPGINGLGFPIGSGLIKEDNKLTMSLGSEFKFNSHDEIVLKIGSGLHYTNDAICVNTDQELFTWDGSTISLNIDNLKTKLGLS